MALLWWDGFDNVSYVSWVPSQQLWEYFDNNFMWVISSNYNGVTPRFGTGKILATRAGGDKIRSASFGNKTEVIVGFAFYITSTTITDYEHFALMDGATTQVEFRFTSSREIKVTRAGTQIGITATNVWAINTWHYLEIKVKINNATGTVDIRLDGNSILSLTGQDTQVTANAYANRFQFRALGNTPNIGIDDMYVVDLTGSQNNSWLGEIRVRQGYPGADGDVNDFTASAGNRWACVDEEVPSDTDYIYSGTVNHKQLFSLASLSLTGSIAAVRLVFRDYKSDTGFRKMKGLWKVGGTEYLDTEVVLKVTPLYWGETRELNPATSAPWIASEVTGSQFGVKVTA